MTTQLKQQHENKHNIKLAYIKQNEMHEVGSTYFNGYWKEYTQLPISQLME